VPHQSSSSYTIPSVTIPLMTIQQQPQPQQPQQPPQQSHQPPPPTTTTQAKPASTGRPTNNTTTSASARPSAKPNQPSSAQKYTTLFLDKVNEQNETNFIIMIDKSGSMRAGSKKGDERKGGTTRWEMCSNVVKVLTQACIVSSPEGISLYFFGSPGTLGVHNKVKSQDQVNHLFDSIAPKGTTCLDEALSEAFCTHLKRKPEERIKIPTSILVITDGEPNSKTAVLDLIISLSKKAEKPGGISVSFMQIGDEEMCAKFFGKLNKPKNKNKYPNVAVDCLTYDLIKNIEEFVAQSLGGS